MLKLTDAEVRSAWQPYDPGRDGPWNRRRAAHLYRRAGFGADRSQLDDAVARTPADVVDELLDGDAPHTAFTDQMATLAKSVVSGGDGYQLAAWWLYRMIHTPAPALEQLTLFWHGHFATSAAKVPSTRLMYQQNETLRKHALGPFEKMVQAIARDPAMLIYLDSRTNRKKHPNENFAREVMELFCLGLDQYTEKDIQELARCFTGWEIRHERFRFNRFQHDSGEKTVLGSRGNFGGKEGVRVVLRQPAAPRFVAEKLIRYYVSDTLPLEPALLDPLAKQLRASDFRIQPVLRTIFGSRLFYSHHALGTKVRGPVELAVGLLRSLDGTTSTTALVDGLQPLGQTLFYPPSVKGWDGGRTWINSTTLIGRANLVRQILEDKSTRFGGGKLEDLLDRHRIQGPAQTVDWLLEQLIAVPINDAARGQLLALLEAPGDRHERLTNVVHAISMLPEFHVC